MPDDRSDESSHTGRIRKLFARQRAKATRPSGEIDLDLLETLVVAAYEEAERDRERTDRSMALMVEEVDQAHQRLLDAFEAVPEGLAMFDVNDRLVFWNRCYAELVADVFGELTAGMQFEEIHRAALAKGRFPTAVGREEEWLAERLARHRAVESHHTDHLPGDRWIQVVERRTKDGGSIGVRIDITDLKRREESFRLLFESNPVPMWVYDLETLRFLAVNEATVRHYGYGREQFARMTLLDIRPAEDWEKVRRFVRDIGGNDNRGTCWRHLKADGTVIEVMTYARSLQYEDRAAALVAVIDVTERKRAENELRRTQEFLNTIVENVPSTIIVKNASDFRYVLINRAGEEYLGMSRDKIIGKTAYEFMPKASADLVTQLDQELVQTREKVCNEHTLDTPGHGSRIAVSRRLPILNAAGDPEYVLAVVEDVTEQRSVQQQLQQAVKMEAVGNLTGGLAHDFNNLLTVIIGNLDLLQEEVAGYRPAEQKVEAILKASLHGAELTRQMLAFSRRQPLKPTRVNIADLVTNTARLLTRTLGENVTIELQSVPEPWPVLVDAAQLEAAIVNIAINARDAMPKGGKLVIRTSNMSFRTSRFPELPFGDYVVVEITDTGKGMPPEVAARVFEPFFTTKAPGKGTGLGLSMVYGFMKQSGGHIAINSQIEFGTTLTLYFPRAAVAAGESGEAAKAAAETRPSVPKGEAILVVDDDAQVRSTAVRHLKGLGYRVLEAEDAHAALVVLASAEPVDLLFTDVIMPGGMNGRELAAAALLMRPGLKVLLTSGFPGAPGTGDAELNVRFALLSKPYRRSDLEKAIRDALDQPMPQAA
jgi:PAS domain S-box-containing protein